MSPDVITMVIALFAFTVTVLGGVAGLLARQSKTGESRLDERFANVDARFAQVDARFAQVDARFDRLDARLDRVESELVDVKIAVARLEGPPPHLQRI